jgi:hypothetical protein
MPEMGMEAEDREFRRLSLGVRTAEVALARFQAAHTVDGRFAIGVSEVAEYARLSKDVELRTAERATYALYRE